ncbi:hypothetical protein M0R45_031568 [Rubus argutus]|uniref:Secreted protein n=1 Tax=Rubus argutus TaxID=59490 RepID=A0AAW1WDY9_RUBAR
MSNLIDNLPFLWLVELWFIPLELLCSAKVSISGAPGSASSELFVVGSRFEMGNGGVGQNHRAGDVPSGMGLRERNSGRARFWIRVVAEFKLNYRLIAGSSNN